jgi:hypothetical protein
MSWKEINLKSVIIRNELELNVIIKSVGKK